MPNNERMRWDRLRAQMEAAGIDALVCRLPENVMYITDYWAHHGFSVVVFPKDGKPLLYAPGNRGAICQGRLGRGLVLWLGAAQDGDLYENSPELAQECDRPIGPERRDRRVREDLRDRGHDLPLIDRSSRHFPVFELVQNLFAEIAPGGRRAGVLQTAAPSKVNTKSRSSSRRAPRSPRWAWRSFSTSSSQA